MSFVTPLLHELKRFWIEGSVASLDRIPPLCAQIATLARTSGGFHGADANLLREAGLLASAVNARSGACLALQTRTGTYSIRGVFEAASGLATIGWEG